MALEWYIIHVFSGSEEFVVKALEEKIIKYKMQDQVNEGSLPDLGPLRFPAFGFSIFFPYFGLHPDRMPAGLRE